MAKRKSTPGDRKAAKVFKEFKAGTLNSGSAKGPKVTSHKQAIAIALSEKQRTDAKRKRKPARKSK